jgi:nucleobase:cation symporter-1, NCS1 family
LTSPRTTTANDAFRIERRGTEIVPLSDRRMSARAIGGLWAGASFNVEYFVYGALLMGFGFSFVQAVALTVVGNLSFLLLGVASLQGPDAGTTTFAISRSAFGTRGARIVAFFNWVTMLGFETEGLILVVGACLSLATMAGIAVHAPLKVAFVVGAVLVQAALPVFGHATMVRLLRWLIAPFAFVYLIVVVFVLHHGHATFTSTTTVTWPLVSAGLAFTIALSGLGWTECGNDYTRYVSPTTPRRSLVGWIFVGTAVPQIFLMVLGAATYTFLSTPRLATAWNSANPFDALINEAVLPRGLVVLVLVMAIVQLLAINSLDLYSSGVSLQAVGLRLHRYQAVVVDSLLAGALTMWAEFAGTFSLFMKEFVGVIIVWITPWFTIFILDWLVRGRRYDADGLRDLGRSSPYFVGRWGVRTSSLVAFVVGIVASTVAFSKAPPPVNFPFHWMTPLSNAFGSACAGSLSHGACAAGWYGGADFSIVTGSVAAAVVFLGLEALGRARQARENALKPR